jgi:hypothetical protein
MGIGSDAIELLIRLRQSGLLRTNGAVMEIGAQQLANSFLEASGRLAELGSLFEIDRPLTLPLSGPSRIAHGGMEHLEATAPRARQFWQWLGFDYAAVDIDGSPGSIPLDLNYDRTPPETVGRYDLVTNFGTTEHIANQLNAFKVIHEMTAFNGLMTHQLPAQGMLNHGLFDYNFKFFWMLARSNGYKIIEADFTPWNHGYDFPDDILGFLTTYSKNATAAAKDFRVVDAGISVTMQKSFDIPFVAPIDVPTGTRADNEQLRERYWTVFKERAFENLQAVKGTASKDE